MLLECTLLIANDMVCDNEAMCNGLNNRDLLTHTTKNPQAEQC